MKPFIGFLRRRRDGGRAEARTDSSWGKSEPGTRARSKLIALIYNQLRQVASGLMRRQRTDHTLSPTAVVHEAVIRLLGEADFDNAPDRNYPFAAAARAMREVLIGTPGGEASARRGKGWRRVPIDMWPTISRSRAGCGRGRRGP